MMKVEDKIKKLFKKLRKTRNISSIREINYQNLKELIKTDTNINIVDIRSPQEFSENRIRYAINIPLYDLEKEAENRLPDKTSLIVLYCEHGQRSKIAYKILENKGYINIYSLKGGIESIF